MKNRRRAFSLFVAVAVVAICSGLTSLAFAAQDSHQQTINLTVTSTITLSLTTSTVNLGTLTPGTPVSADTSLTVTTNDYNGFNLQVKRDDSTSTLHQTSDPSIQFPDATAWNYSSPNGQIAASVGANLSFRVKQTGTDADLYSSTYWGTDDTAPNALFAGFPTSNQQIASDSGYVGIAQNVAYTIMADSPATQQSGNYTGTITMTAITNP